MKILCLLFLTVIRLCAEERSSSAPYLSGDTFRAHADYVYDETMNTIDVENLVFGSTLFVKTDMLFSFFEEIHPRIVQPYVLITHNSDAAIPGNHAFWLNDDKLLAWFGTNIEHYQHPKLHPIPIGLANRYWPHGNIETFKEVIEGPHFVTKEHLLYMNFTAATNLAERSKVYYQFINEPYCFFSHIKSFKEYLLDVQKSQFVLSPRGNGLDCHRTWEALYLGAIPIVISSKIDSLFEDLPVLVIEDWKAITPSFLGRKLEELADIPQKREKLFSKYWFKQMDAFKKPRFYPIQFSISACKVINEIPHKERDFAGLIPGHLETYVFDEEADYYRDYQRAYFAVTCKKGGWDCMRHYEIMANGCIPYFLDLEQCDPNTLPFLPRKLIEEAMHLEGVHFLHIDHSKFDKKRYFELLEALMQAMRNSMTSEAVARYVLENIGYSGEGKILYLSEDLRPDYMRCCTLIGLKEVLGDQVVDFPKVPHIYKNYPGNSAHLYGKGFSYTKIIDDFPIDRENLEERIRNKEFTHVIYGSVHRGLPYHDLVREVYSTEQISYICGEEGHACSYSHYPNLFLRESEDFVP